MIKIIQSDITALQVDAVVNAANESLLGGGGVDGAIHRAAGSELREYNIGLGGCNTGEARLSPGFKLPAQWIIHTVGPVWHGGNRGEADLLASCYREVFRIAIEQKIKTIAFPAISTGMYGYPKEAAAKIALSIMKTYESSFTEIVVCCFSTGDVNIYYRQLLKLSASII
ncbi:MAG: O-acetyl-ADP-ribose deacetylase [Gammaproteobacteria bacterium RIFCSPLOWO2_02_FULL_52_10]|nr:MAG: O-acetyl-ADP-ribose deacetylase [Gammaproteobacteria bacterium RIFCSPLOWO2_12_FULL_52_10]OGT82590.1 MAG: O-acetyl-ADP-ribose deacetylase [Gammaproteobacteria bacterium RIFCSPLOWO2_02_FULL_52_10]